MHHSGVTPATPGHGAAAHTAEFDQAHNRVIITLSDGRRFGVSSKNPEVQKKMQQICASFNEQLNSAAPEDIEKTIKYLQKTAAASAQGAAPAPKSVYHCVYNPKTNQVAFLRDKGTRKGELRLEITAAASKTHTAAANTLRQGQAEAGSRKPLTEEEIESWLEEEGGAEFDPAQYVGKLEQHLEADIKHLDRLKGINADLREKRSAGQPIDAGYITQQLQWLGGIAGQINSPTRKALWEAVDQFAKEALPEVQQRYQTIRGSYSQFVQEFNIAQRDLRAFLPTPGPSMNEGPVAAPAASSVLPASADQTLETLRTEINESKSRREEDLGGLRQWFNQAKTARIIDVAEIRQKADFAQKQLEAYQEVMRRLKETDRLRELATPEVAQAFPSARFSFEEFYTQFNQTTQELLTYFKDDLRES